MPIVLRPGIVDLCSKSQLYTLNLRLRGELEGNLEERLGQKGYRDCASDKLAFIVLIWYYVSSSAGRFERNTLSLLPR